MAVKSANVTARVEPEVKEKAEAILNEMGIPASTAINIFYRPFRPSTPPTRPRSREEMPDEEFDARMAAGLAQAKENLSAPMDETFSRLIGEIAHGKAI